MLQWSTIGVHFVSVSKKPTFTELRFREPAPVHLVEEIDSTRIIASDWCDILEPVHPQLFETQKTASMAPVTLLFEARLAYDHGEADAERNMRALKDEGAGVMGEAVKQCCQVATAEYNAEVQQQFLRAASYGKSFCKDLLAKELTQVFRAAHKKIRILNNLRDPLIGKQSLCCSTHFELLYVCVCLLV